MDYLELVYDTLKKVGRPLHYRDIASLSGEPKLLSISEDQLPLILAAISKDIAEKEEAGETSRFISLGKGVIGLTEWVSPATEEGDSQPGKRNYWLLTTDKPNFDIDRGVLNFSVQGLRERNKKTVQRFRPGDRVVYYLKGICKLGAIATITSGYYRDQTKLWNESDEMWPSRTRSEPYMVLEDDELIDVKKLIPNLSIVFDEKNWGLAFQGSIRQLPEDDYILIESEFRKVIANREMTRAKNPPVLPRLKTETDYKRAIMKMPLRSGSLKERLAEMLESVGTWLGYNTSVNHRISPDHIYRLDVAWLRGKNPEIAFQIQIGGNLTESKEKLVQARKFNYRKLVIVIEETELEKLKTLFRFEDLRPIPEAWSIPSIYELYTCGSRFFSLLGRLEDSRFVEGAAVELN